MISNIVQGSESNRLALLIHGYGADERDLGGLLSYLDPNGSLAVVLPRGNFPVPGSAGYAWYGMFQDDGAEGSYGQALAELDDLLTDQAEALRLPRDESIVAGFSQGAGLALGLALQRSDRPRPKAALAMSPALDTAAFDLDPHDAPPVLVQHGTHDPLIPVKRARDLARELRSLGVPTVYREYPMEHQVALESLRDASDWLTKVYAGDRPDEPIPDDPVELVPSVTTAQWDVEVLRSELPVIVDFWAPWCGPCRQVSPVVETIAAMRQGFYKVVKVNIDEEPKLAEQYGVQSIPMIGLIRNGRLERASVGAKARPALEADLGMLVIP
ncbi:MAG: thioredoxin domain-containing protein [Acidimicrobiia bacterium]